MLSWESLWHNAKQLEYLYENDEQISNNWDMKYVSRITDLAKWIQSNVGVYPQTQTWALYWLSDNPTSLRFAIEALLCALISDGLQYEETIKKSKPLFHKEQLQPKYLSPDTNAFVKDCIKAYASLASDSQIWLNLLSSFDHEQREFTILEGTMACELAKSHLLPLHQRISLREYVTTSQEKAYDDAMFSIFHHPSHTVTVEEWNQFLNKVRDVKTSHVMYTYEQRHT